MGFASNHLLAFTLLISGFNSLSSSQDTDVLHLVQSLSQFWSKEAILIVDPAGDISDDIILDQLKFTVRGGFNLQVSRSCEDVEHYDFIVCTSQCECSSEVLQASGTTFLLNKETTNIDKENLRLDSDIYLFSTSETGYTLAEVYALRKEMLIESDIGFWNRSTGLTIFSSEKYARRSDLKGLKLRSAYILYDNYFMRDSNGIFSGYDYEILLSLSLSLNFTLEHSISPDGSYGVLTPEGEWNGILGALNRNETDIGCAGMVKTVGRLQAVDFTEDIYEERLTAIVGITGEKLVQPWVFTDAFTVWAWGGFAFFGLLVTATLFFTRNRTQLSPLAAWSLAGLHFLQRDLEFDDIRRKGPGLRMAYFTSAIFGFATFSSYCALLTATMTTNPALPIITTLAMVLEKDYQVLVWENTFLHSLFLDSKPGTTYHDVLETLQENPESLYSSIQEGKQKLLANPKALILDYETAFLSNDNFAVLSTYKESFKVTGSFPLQKNSEFSEILNYQVKRMRQSGLLDRLRRKWFQKTYNVETSEASALGYENLVFPVAILALGITFGAVIMALEKLILYFSRKEATSQKRVATWPYI